MLNIEGYLNHALRDYLDDRERRGNTKQELFEHFSEEDEALESDAVNLLVWATSEYVSRGWLSRSAIGEARQLQTKDEAARFVEKHSPTIVGYINH